MTLLDIAALRKSLGLSQAEFALRYGLDRRSVENWEIGRRQPRGAALTLLRLIEREPARLARMVRALQKPVQHAEGSGGYADSPEPASARPGPPQGR